MIQKYKKFRSSLLSLLMSRKWWLILVSKGKKEFTMEVWGIVNPSRGSDLFNGIGSGDIKQRGMFEQGPKFYLLGYAKNVSGGEDVELKSCTWEDLLYLCIKQLFHEKKNMHMDGGEKKKKWENLGLFWWKLLKQKLRIMNLTYIVMKSNTLRKTESYSQLHHHLPWLS